jgi:hypothetical protein
MSAKVDYREEVICSWKERCELWEMEAAWVVLSQKGQRLHSDKNPWLSQQFLPWQRQTSFLCFLVHITTSVHSPGTSDPPLHLLSRGSGVPELLNGTTRNCWEGLDSAVTLSLVEVTLESWENNIHVLGHQVRPFLPQSPWSTPKLIPSALLPCSPIMALQLVQRLPRSWSLISKSYVRTVSIPQRERSILNGPSIPLVLILDLEKSVTDRVNAWIAKTTCTGNPGCSIIIPLWSC